MCNQIKRGWELIKKLSEMWSLNTDNNKVNQILVNNVGIQNLTNFRHTVKVLLWRKQDNIAQQNTLFHKYHRFLILRKNRYYKPWPSTILEQTWLSVIIFCFWNPIRKKCHETDSLKCHLQDWGHHAHRSELDINRKA